MPETPEQKARRKIGAKIKATGWKVQDREGLDLSAGHGMPIHKHCLSRSNAIGSTTRWSGGYSHRRDSQRTGKRLRNVRNHRQKLPESVRQSGFGKVLIFENKIQIRPAFMADEITFFKNADIAVTNARFIVGARTFAMRGITSVEGVEEPPRNGWAVVFIIFGMILVLTLFVSFSFIGIFGILIFASSMWAAIQAKPTFSVVLRTAGGEVTAYRSHEREHAAQIIQALNNAIVSNC
jgi:hypothetical protein